MNPLLHHLAKMRDAVLYIFGPIPNWEWVGPWAVKVSKIIEEVSGPQMALEFLRAIWRDSDGNLLSKPHYNDLNGTILPEAAHCLGSHDALRRFVDTWYALETGEEWKPKQERESAEVT